MSTNVFISYAKEDKEYAEKLHSDLDKAGVSAWLDSKHLLPGQNWEMIISNAIKDSRYFIALLSSRSVGKKGYVQKEIRHALRIAQEYPPDKVFIIPLRIDECEPAFPDLNALQIANFFPDYEKCLKDLLRVIEFGLPRLTKIDNGFRIGVIHKLLEKGFGFIIYDQWSYFFHMKDLANMVFEELREGDIVSFKMKETVNGIVATVVERG